MIDCMRLFRGLMLVLIAMCGAISAQVLFPGRVVLLGQLRTYLQLTDTQAAQILANNDEYNRWTSEKQVRVYQVQTEIALETAKSPLDPNALGIRYAEIETICREIHARASEYRTKNLNVLTAEQKAKLKVLEDAMNLAPIIADAQNGNLLGNAGSYSPFYTANGGGGLLGAFLSAPLPGCQPTVPTTAFRNGDFSGLVSRQPYPPAAPSN